MNDEQEAFVKKHSAACHPSIVLEHLDWLAAHKRMEADEARMVVLKRDAADILSISPEYAIALAVVWFIEKGSSVWWPSLDELRTRVETFLVPTWEIYLPTNATAMAAERIGIDLANAWFSKTILEGRTLYGSSRFVCDWIQTNYLAQMRDLIDEIVLISEKTEPKNV